MTQSIVVIGGSGFVGQGVCKEALRKNISVISISKHGKPQKEQPWMSHPLMIWVKADIFTDTSWKHYLADCLGCINLIGILFQNKHRGQTYHRMIFYTNHLISSVCEEFQIPYLFLSAKAGPVGYLKAKKLAEQDLLDKTNSVIIIRSGLVTTKRRPLTIFKGTAIQLAAHIPIVHHLAERAYPVSRKKLSEEIIKRLLEKRSVIVNDVR
ncbi:NAD-dependent epimerase/dehydratase family protein [Vagococcus vulneris]|uniref:NAD-dependent epimerase/dehydratase domain-containing protein n=1 Tax=Vagococcus vulneris TaxID=1977869 RepID=A0A429ZY80_9ENTE|nr:NAD-dependent epimerase/dehydratase family protein [Vagococcus vulneris]RST98901.1 hypothetical protein CBF37_05890 [Vagococcus vulneris]